MQVHKTRCPRFLSVLLLVICVLPFDILSAPAGSAQIEKRFEQKTEPLSRPRPETDVQIYDSAPPANANSIKLTLNRLVIEGASVVEQAALAGLYEKLIGTEISLQQVYDLARDITSYFGSHGYLLSRAIVPPQRIDNGVVKIHVVEGYIDEVIVEADNIVLPDLFDHYKAQILASRPLHIDVMERYLLLANDLPGISFKSVLNPSKKNAGAANLVMKASFKPWETTLTLDNYGSESSGPAQLLLETTYHHHLVNPAQTSLRLATVPGAPDELRYLNFNHVQTLNAEGLRLGFGFLATESEPGEQSFNALEIETEGQTAELNLYYPLIRTREENLVLGGSLSARKSDILQLGVRSSRDQLRVLRLTGQYDKADAYLGGGISLMSATLNFGLDVADAMVESRLEAEPDFSHLQLSLRRVQQLSQSFKLDLRLQAQYANETLPSAEQFGLGGETSVRGYDPAEWTGDRAVTASGELSYNLPAEQFENVRLYGFYDYGKIWLENGIILVNGEDSLAVDAFGIGTSIDFQRDVALNLELTRPLDEDSYGDSDDYKLFGRISVTF